VELRKEKMRIITALIVDDCLPAVAAITTTLLACNMYVEVALTVDDAWMILSQSSLGPSSGLRDNGVKNTVTSATTTNSSGIGTIDLVLLSVWMDGSREDGGELLLKIKSDYYLCSIPVIMLSPVVDTSLNTFCSRNGAECVLLKPCDAKSIEGICRQYRFEGHSIANKTSASAGSSSGSLQVGDAALPFSLLDHEGHVVHVNVGHSLNVTVLAFVPTIFAEYLYADHDTSFIPQLSEEYWSLSATDDSSNFLDDEDFDMFVVSGDLHDTLRAAKNSFKLPFPLLSDPLLQVAKEYVGTSDAVFPAPTDTNAYAQKDPSAETAELLRLQQRQWRAILGFVVIDKKGIIVHKWIGEHQKSGLLDYSLGTPSLLPILAGIS
jgi:peroxiredoxin/response regulator of citrate/malate metabolism